MYDPMPYKSTSVSDFEILRELGKGSFGIVYKVKRKLDKGIYVLKQINISQMNPLLKAAALNEVKILSSLDNPYIVKYYDSFIEKNILNIVMEFCEGGDLSTYIKNQMNRLLLENKIWKFLIQMCIGLHYLHSKKILHRDIKSLNIFLSKDEDVRIGDLGVAKVLADSTNFAHTMVGTPYYLSPEMCEEKPYNEKSDIWALGCVLYEMCTKKHPFEANNQHALILKIIRGRYNPIPSTYTNELIEFVDSCLSKDFQKRPTASQLISRQAFINKARALNINLKPGYNEHRKLETAEKPKRFETPDKKINGKVDKPFNPENKDLHKKLLNPSSIISFESGKKGMLNILNENKGKNTPQSFAKKPDPFSLNKVHQDKVEIKRNQMEYNNNNLFRVYYDDKVADSAQYNIHQVAKLQKDIINPIIKNNPLPISLKDKVVDFKDANKINEAYNAAAIDKTIKLQEKKKFIKDNIPQEAAVSKPIFQMGGEKVIKDIKHEPESRKLSKLYIGAEKEKLAFDFKILKIQEGDKMKSQPGEKVRNQVEENPDCLDKKGDSSESYEISSNSSSDDDSDRLSRAPNKNKPIYQPQKVEQVRRPYSVTKPKINNLVISTEQQKTRDGSLRIESNSQKSETIIIQKEAMEHYSQPNKLIRLKKLIHDDPNAECKISTTAKIKDQSVQNNNSKILEVSNVDKEFNVKEANKDLNDSYKTDQSLEEAYVEQEDLYNDNTSYIKLNQEASKTCHEDQESEKQGHEELTEEISSFSNKESLMQVIENELINLKERQECLENIIKLKVAECSKQLGESNYLEIINFFREKLKVAGELTEEEQKEIDKFVMRKITFNGKIDVVYNICKILNLELENEKCKQKIKKYTF